MTKRLYVSLAILLSGSLAAQTKNPRPWHGPKVAFEGQPASIRLVPGVTTTIRVPEPVNSVVVGDSNLFQAEYSPTEPRLVFVMPMASGIAQTNLVVSTVGGRQFIFLLRSSGLSGDKAESTSTWLSSARLWDRISLKRHFHQC